MIDTVFFSLQFAALIFFNLLCILGIIAVFVFMSTTLSIRKKIEEASDKAQDAFSNVEDISQGVLGIINSLWSPKKKRFWDFMGMIINRKK